MFGIWDQNLGNDAGAGSAPRDSLSVSRKDPDLLKVTRTLGPYFDGDLERF